jgi:ribosomal protein S18 acetylase RimI-like enzyme
VTEIVIRPGTEGDFDALVALDWSSAVHHAAIDPEAYQLPDPDASIEFLRRRLADPAREVFVADADGTVVGMVDVTIIDEPRAGSIHRSVRTADLGISVLSGWRRRGIGRRLMAAAEGSARRRGATRIVLDMSAANAAALQFYRALGYVDHEMVLRRTLSRWPHAQRGG